MATLYLKVTKDKYELPVAIADSKAELADMLGVDRTSVYRGLKRRKGESVYIAVEVEDVERHERRTGS
jgi:hypothetical protein